jgi:hypothetical protein
MLDLPSQGIKISQKLFQDNLIGNVTARAVDIGL